MNEVTNQNPVVNFLKKFISFESFLTPSIIVFIFWLSIIGVCFSGLAAFFSGYFIAGILEIILGAIFVKVFCEILIVLFKINDNLKEIAKNTRK
ncbi:DUF4282 domain-containing protein [Francisella hispaniensis]|uniref:DUF4282 domain-containing protein n=1 Tax=Francisella hispaniensis FSC454 TaxID=1088883 RepID=A0AAC9NP83_9GAMM|nr:DUF4282 domain-containing protein [Francisella hispaniensis]APD49904.1 hypothetical protein FSC454_01470 [Francisella hispaniensis FSC454]KYW86305.1 hypothetical protein AUF42_03760 [Francisella hispaniensis FSC454]